MLSLMHTQSCKSHFTSQTSIVKALPVVQNLKWMNVLPRSSYTRASTHIQVELFTPRLDHYVFKFIFSSSWNCLPEGVTFSLSHAALSISAGKGRHTTREYTCTLNHEWFISREESITLNF